VAYVTAEQRLRDLEELYGRLRADVEKYGTLVETPSGLKANPSVAEMRRVSVELGKMAAPVVAEEAEDDIISSLRIA
jgi:hypothetical protein